MAAGACQQSCDLLSGRRENLSAADVKGATIVSLMVAALLFSLAYAPSRSGCENGRRLPNSTLFSTRLPRCTKSSVVLIGFWQ